MADALISMVLKQFSSYAEKEVELVVGVREEIDKLNLTLSMIQGVLQDAEQKQVKSNTVKIWLQELKNVLYGADDLMDEWNTKMAVFQRERVGLGDNSLKRRKKVLSLFRSPFSCFKHVTVRYDIGRRIKKIGKWIDEINAKRSQFDLTISSSHIQARSVTSSIVDVSKVRGRDQDKEIIVSKLLGESSRQDVGIHVVAIVGMGGFGKTTLAKLVLEEERVAKSFWKTMWVYVSEPFDLIRVAKAIIEEVGEEVPSSEEWQAMHKRLSESVSGKRFLLVLDDVWTKDSNHWNQLKLSLDGGAPGSRVIVTTRNMEVAHMMGSSHIHILEKLSENDSWSLLGDIALMGREEEREKFESIGKEIANKCKGVPLVLSTLAALLCEKRTVQNWRDILASDIWELSHVKDFFLPSLFLSYYSLPSVSKQCFLYCALFLKDTRMKKDLLVKLWMAEGFLGSGRMGELERVGEDHFDNLAMRSFFRDFKKDSNGKITSCKMHDLVHDFARYLSHGECSNGTEFDCDKVRYCYSYELENSLLYKAKKMRTLLHQTDQRKIWVELFSQLPCLRVLDLHNSYGFIEAIEDSSLYDAKKVRGISVELFRKLLCLRVLDLQWTKRKELPEEVEKLVHLRYLDLSGRKMLELPKTICNLYNLQTLIINDCKNLCKLPEGIGQLSNLRHLEMVGTDELRCLPQSIKKLSSLRTLSKFIVSEECNIGGLKHLNNLRGALELTDLGGMTNENDVIQADLKKKRDLHSLSFNWELNDAAIGMENMFERLEPPEDLEVLEIFNYPGSRFPFWFDNSSVLGNIVNMELSECHNCTQLPAFGKLTTLESLKIYGMHSVMSIGHEFYGFGVDSSFGAEMIAFPKLKKLELWSMDKLEKWELPIISKSAKVMCLLCELILRSCPKLETLPFLGKLESLEILEVSNLASVIRLDLGISDGGIDYQSVQQEQVIFPKLRRLHIFYMSSLEQWNLLFGKHGVNMMPSLCDLTIEHCPRLTVLPDLTKFKSLISLKLFSVGKLEEELKHFTILQELEISWCPLLEERFQGDGWRSILAHVPKITIQGKEITNYS